MSIDSMAHQPARPDGVRTERRAGGFRKSLRMAADGLTVLGILFGLYYVALAGEGLPVDVRAYFLADPAHPYVRSLVNTPGAYLYSPAFAQIVGPFQALDWEAFRTLWRVMSLLALAWLAGPFTLLALLFSPVLSEINAGNIHLLLGAAVVAGFRWPATWAFVLLTKVTPGVGLLWFAVRREWRALATALLVTASIIGVSFVLNPGAWREWLDVLALNSNRAYGPMPVDVPLWLRVAVAAILVIWGARTGRPGTVPLAALLAVPALWFHAFAMLAAALPFIVPSLTPAGRFLGDRARRQLPSGVVQGTPAR